MSPRPIHQFVLKVHSRCDLACDHCYVYEHRDHGWRDQPRRMTAPVARAAAGRIAEHAATHQLATVTVILHGGEPLLAGADGLRAILTELRTVIDPVARLELRMQSNGVQLTAPLCDLLAEFGVRVGISSDGDREANDRHRLGPDGRSAHDAITAALTLLREHPDPDLYAGILCTVDVANDPIQVYEAVRAARPRRVDFLLPHGTHDHPPPRLGEYGSWLLRIFHRWNADGRPMRVRLFDSLLATGRAGASGTESVGLQPVDLAVIETNGRWEQADSLKTAFDGAAATGLNVFRNPVDEVAALPAIVARQQGLAGLCTTCRACPVVQQCGGGLYAHRYHAGSFDHPSVYCADLLELITGINRAEAANPATGSSGSTGTARDVLAQLGSGYGDTDALAELVARQRFETHKLVRAVGDRVRPGSPAEHGWRLLLDLQRQAPEPAAAVLAHPYLRAWAVRVLRGDRDGLAPASADRLCAVAAAIGLRAGIGYEGPVPVCAGQVFLPTVGTARLSRDGSGTGRIAYIDDELRLSFDGATTVVRDGVAVDGGWQPGRTVELAATTVRIEDQDPDRACHDWAVEPPLSAAGGQAFATLVHAAWSGIERDAAPYLPGLTTGLRVITPLIPDPAGRQRSSTARQAFGAVAVAATTPDAVAVMLVHEFQHCKLNAVLDHWELFDPSHPARISVGWRPDPRPVEGVLQGSYAHLAVTAIWRSRVDRGVPGAEATWRQYRDWTAAAIDELSASGALTGAGTHFVERMAQTLAGLA